MDSLPLDKFNGINFHTWNKMLLWSAVKGTEKAYVDAKLFVEWEKNDDRVKTIIGLSLSVDQLHLIDIGKTSKQI